MRKPLIRTRRVKAMSGLNGHCLCGGVRFQATPAKPKMGVRHCSMCRRWRTDEPPVNYRFANTTGRMTGAEFPSAFMSSKGA
jgi:hypothetical protein